MLVETGGESSLTTAFLTLPEYGITASGDNITDPMERKLL
jgi:hypothetical protein